MSKKEEILEAIEQEGDDRAAFENETNEALKAILEAQVRSNDLLIAMSKRLTTMKKQFDTADQDWDRMLAKFKVGLMADLEKKISIALSTAFMDFEERHHWVDEAEPETQPPAPAT